MSDASAIRFHFDFVSPYSYVAWHRIASVAATHGRSVEAVPILFAGLLAAYGTVGPAEVPAKRAYIVKDTTRAARAAGVPFGPPPTHPFNPLLALRVTVQPMPEPTRRALVDRLFAATWGGDGPGVEDAHVVEQIADQVGLDGAAFVAAARSSPEPKALLREQTDRAIASGVFGIPTMIVDGELFWGNDSVEHLDRFLAGADPVTAQDIARWAAIRPSAVRRIK